MAEPADRARRGAALPARGAGHLDMVMVTGWHLAVVGTARAFPAWIREVQRCRSGLLSSWTFLTPVFGIAAGFLRLGERPSGWTAPALVFVPASMWVVLRPPAERRTPVDAEEIA